MNLNLPLRDPLAPVAEDLDAADWRGRDDGRPWVELREHSSAPDADDIQALAERIAATPRGAIVCGDASALTGSGAATTSPTGTDSAVTSPGHFLRMAVLQGLSGHCTNWC